MNIYLVFALGVLAGVMLHLALLNLFELTKCEHGDFVVEKTEEGKIICRLEIEKLVGIENKKCVILRVKNVPHK